VVAPARLIRCSADAGLITQMRGFRDISALTG
jgi:hypothetical protein